MFKSAGTKIIGLALLAAVVLGAGIYATTALLPGGASAYTASTQPATAQAAPTEVTPTSRGMARRHAGHACGPHGSDRERSRALC